MDELFIKSDYLVHKIAFTTKRSLYQSIQWSAKLIGIKGARGTGKTTLMLQRIHELGLPASKALFISLDDFYFNTHSLAETAENFIKKGGQILFLDEVHKYPNWSQQIKNIYDFSDIQVVFTGSSIIDISKEEGDLSRRAIMYQLNGLSFREFLNIEHRLNLPQLALEELLERGSMSVKPFFPEKFKPYAYFDEYLQFGYYPIYKEDKTLYSIRLQQVVRQIIEYDMAELKNFDIRNAKKMLQLLGIIAENVPFKPNIQGLAEKTGMNRSTLYNYIHFLEEAKLIQLLYPAGISVSTLQKPEKIYLENTNLAFSLSGMSQPNMGNLRETFVLNQLKSKYLVEAPQSGDFILNNTWVLEIGGKNKSKKQLIDNSNSFRVLDDFEFTSLNDVVPLWMIGFLY